MNEKKTPDAASLDELEHASLTHLAHGKDVPEIAAALQLPPERIEAALVSAQEKLGAASRLQAVLMAARLGLIEG